MISYAKYLFSRKLLFQQQKCSSLFFQQSISWETNKIRHSMYVFNIFKDGI